MRSPEAERAKQKREQSDEELLREKDREIARFRVQIRTGPAPSGGGDAAETDLGMEPVPSDRDQSRLLEIASTLKQLGVCKEPLVIEARDKFIEERDAIKARIVNSKPFAGQLHHFTTRIEALEKQRVQ